MNPFRKITCFLTNPSNLPLVIMWTLLGGAGFTTLLLLISIYENNPDYSHGYLVPLIIGYVIYEKWRESKTIANTTFYPAFLPFVLGLIFMWLGYWYEMAMSPGGLGTEFLCATGLALAVSGSCLICFGVKKCRYFIFPLFYMIFAIPLPESWALQITLPLRRLVSTISAYLLPFVGIQVEQQGNVLKLDALTLGIADACSGIRSLWALLASSVAISYLIHARIKLILFLSLLAFPLAIAQNILRVIFTALLVTHVNTDFAEGWKHDATGWFSFLFAAICWVYIAHRLIEKFPPLPRPALSKPAHNNSSPKTLLAVAFCSMLCMGAQFAIWRHYAPRYLVEITPPGKQIQLSNLPSAIGSFIFMDESDVDGRSLKILQPTDYYVANYYKPNNVMIQFMLFYWDPQRLGAYGSTFRPHSPDVCFPNAGWERDELLDKELPFPGLLPNVASQRIYHNGNMAQAVLYWRSLLPGQEFEQDFPNPLWARVQALINSWREADLTLDKQYSVTVVADATKNREEACNAVREFAEALLPYLKHMGFDQ